MPVQKKTFYDDHPFDWTEAYTLNQLHGTLAPTLRSFIEHLPEGGLVLEMGCGTGRVTTCVEARPVHCLGVDVSRASVQRMVRRCGSPGVVATALRLPLPDDSVDYVIADGVIHHTGNPPAAFAECCRVLKSGGLFYAAVYKPGGRYERLYGFPGSAIRRLVKNRAGKLLVHATLLPLYYLAHVAKSRGKTSWYGAKNLFYDYFVTPVVAFVSRDEVSAWCELCGIDMAQYDPNPSLNVHSFVFRKPLPPSTAVEEMSALEVSR